jgi:hypothetical protein
VTEAESERRARLAALVAGDPLLMTVLRALRTAALPDAWLCSGAVIGRLWNALTGRDATHGLKDIDLIYFDPDTGWAAEDRAQRRLAPLAAVAGVPVEVRNQARVHLWFPDRFGLPYPALPDACASLRLYASRSFAAAVRLGPGGVEIAAPFGLGDAFALRLVPNTALPNAAAYAAKANRIAALWPEVRIEPWPPCAAARSAGEAGATAEPC